MPSDLSPEPIPGAQAPQPPLPPHAPLQDALLRVVSPAPWWRRWLRALPGRTLRRVPRHALAAEGRRSRGVFPVVAALGVVLLLSLVGVAAPWNTNTAPAQDSGTIQDGPVLLEPSPEAGNPDPPPGRSQAGETRDTGDRPCPDPLSVVATPEIATLVLELAGSLAGGACPQVQVSAEESAATVQRLAGGGTAPDAWLPASTLWLRLAASGGAELPAAGTSIARSPVVMALPQPVADQLAAEDAWPVWLTFYDKVASGEIPRMSMADRNTTAGALALVAFLAAAEFHWGDDGESASFLGTIHFRDNLAATDANPAELLDRLATTSPSQSATQVGVFPTTEQQLLVHQDRNPATRAVPCGTCEAMAEADYPLAISESLDDRLAAIADELRAQLRSPAAVQRFTGADFHPPRDRSDPPFIPEHLCSNDPAPVPLPTAAGWQSLVDGWTWTG